MVASAFHAARHVALGQIAGDWIDGFSRKVVAQFRIGVARKELPEIFTGVAIGEVLAQKPLDGFRYFGREAAIANRPRDGLIQTESATEAKVVSIHHVSTDL